MSLKNLGVGDVKLVIVIKKAGGTKGETSEVGAEVRRKASRGIAEMVKN